MKIGVVVFPGSNCDHDAFHAASLAGGSLAGGSPAAGIDVCFLWHASADLEGCDAVILPGGFSYGDYLRTGALARFSPVMAAVSRLASAGGPVLGICNGFQILCEAGLLPGVLLRNAQLRFVCRPVHVRVETTATPFTQTVASGQVLSLPIAHGEGNYSADPDTLALLERDQRIVFRYCGACGERSPEANPNGSAHDIAGICNAGRNVVGLMPHPERASEIALGSADGLALFTALAGHAASSTVAAVAR